MTMTPASVTAFYYHKCQMLILYTKTHRHEDTFRRSLKTYLFALYYST